MKQAREMDASDLILVPGKPPCAYIHGQLTVLEGEDLSPDAVGDMLSPLLSEEQSRRLADTGDVDFSRGDPGFGRARINIHKQRNSYAAAIRFINSCIPSIQELNLPTKVSELAHLPRGLILVTGSTGSGKSTTLAAMIEYMNHQFDRHIIAHIIALEDPIEYIFGHNRCVIEQREIGLDSPTFADALRHVVRQKPDVILLGEMRDRETVAAALTAAETGHLVLGTLHTNSAAQTIERVTDVFDAAHQPQIRVQLANTLQAVICQSLIPRVDQQGMIPAVEMMVMTPAIRRAIRECETHLIPGMIETGQKLGMWTLDQALADLVGMGTVALDDALARAVDAEKLSRMIGRSGSVTSRSAPASHAGVADAGVESMMWDGPNSPV
jgi:twitching motility protein PilT